jgi:hypothetical protein
MVEPIKSWVRENSAVAIFLIAQTIALMSALAYIVNWKADMESRVLTMETRGAAFMVNRMDSFDKRITITEGHIAENTASIDRIKEFMLREFKPQQQNR